MSFVLDASVPLAWFFEDEFTAYAGRVRSALAAERVVVTWLWPVEVVNALAMAERRGRIEAAMVDRALQLLEKLPVEVQTVRADTARLLEICRRHQRTAYDALYLDLVLRERCAVATLDGGMRHACFEAGIEVLSPG